MGVLGGSAERDGDFAPQLFPAALQRLSRKIVQSRAHSTVIGVFTILLVFIAAFVNMVGTWGWGVGGRGSRSHPSRPLQFTCSRVSLRDCAAHELNVTPEAVGPCQLRTLNLSLGSPAGPCHRHGLACDFPEVRPVRHPWVRGWDGVLCGRQQARCSGGWYKVPEDAGCWQGVPWVLERGPHRRRVLAGGPHGCWNRVPTDAGCWQGSLWVLERGPHRHRVLTEVPMGAESCTGTGAGSLRVQTQCPQGCWRRVPEGAGCQRGVPVGTVSSRVLAWGPQGYRVL